MDRPAQEAREIEEAIRVWLRERRERLHLSYRDLERETGIRHSFFSDFNRAQFNKVLTIPTLDARKRALAIAYPDLRTLLHRLSIAWEEGL